MSSALTRSSLKKLFLALALLLLVSVVNAQKKSKKGINDRAIWLGYLDMVARPVMSNLAEDRLKEKMPVELAKNVDNAASRSKVAYLEAFGRTLSGIGPWLNLEGGSKEELALREQYRIWALKALSNAVNPSSKDYMQWTGGQPLVDASFMAFGLIRCPWLWQNSSDTVKKQVVEAFKATRETVPVYTNWLLFSGMIEAFFCKYGMEYDKMRMEFGVREFAEHWYTGDGLFSDGNQFHLDYYNSYVIQPYLSTIVNIANRKNKQFIWFTPKLDKITKRYAEIQEKLINTDGSFPITGRSIVYRGGAFHHLADMAYQQHLPPSLSPAQVRGALTAVIQRTLSPAKTFNDKGWLNIGLAGQQSALADFYITTGSLYISSLVFLPLGLPETDEFWASPAAPWTSLKVWNGQDVPADHALDLK
ncbi:DUF2264 domain-containing protein [Desertivirga arenae]|uniref:DUF2264 domain-containing protein n=1 Tax=Desertivirga arenae TaxID=2810309 RepID=UPI001A96D6A7|nr:DUF2264 domain-containing protein [Pedobacter sp. SYSU D00823]